MGTTPFEGLTPAGDTSHTEWIVDALPPAPPGVSFRIPAGFKSILRIHHPLHGDARWADVAPDLLAPGGDHVEVPWSMDERVDAEEGSLDTSIVDQLVPLLAAATSTPDGCHYGLWRGFGGGGVMLTYTSAQSPWGRWRQRRTQSAHQRCADATHQVAQEFIERCAVREWCMVRDFALFDGSVDDVRSIGNASLFATLDGRKEIDRRSPQWWWPEDRAWFVATEIDDPWTYLAGTDDLIAAVEALELESVLVSYDDLW